jgi:hypothetical protein
MARPKKASVVLGSIDDCTRAMGELLVTITELEILTAESDRARAAASAQFEKRLDAAHAQKAGLEMALRDYYYTHLAEVEQGGVKHKQLANGVMGRRDNPAALKPLNRQWTWAAILQAVTTGLGIPYLRIREPELDKDKLKTLGNEKLRNFGMKLEIDETFYAEPARLPEVV